MRARLGIGRSFQNLGLMMPETVERNVAAAQHLGAGYAGWDLAARPWRWRRGERRIAERRPRRWSRSALRTSDARPVGDLSFAAARFVELAAVLVEAPKLMLLDEPTTGLDAAEVATLVATLEQLRARGTTILVIAHDVGFVMQCCDHVYVLAEGRVLSEGPPEVGPARAVGDRRLPGGPGVSPVLKVDRLTTGYLRAPVLRDVSLEVGDEIVALFGANGAGKTTLLRAISGTLPAWKGSVTIGGRSLGRSRPWRRVRLGVAHVPEGRHVFTAMTVKENLDVAGLAGR